MTSISLPGSPFVHYSNDELHLESCSLEQLAQKFGTPLFAYSKASMLGAVNAYQRGFAGHEVQICYAMKANSNLSILQLLAKAGCGFDIVSGGELKRALAAGAQAEKIIFSGVGKTREEMRLALRSGIGCFNVESEAELDVLNEVALSVGKVAPVSIRFNPDVDPKTHPYISTGLKGNKFGIAQERTLPAYKHAASLKGLRVAGIDYHIGSQITQSGPFLEAVDRMLDMVESIEAAGIPIHHIDFGGGLGIQYAEDMPPQIDDLCARLLAKMDARGHGKRKLVIEPGRSLVGNAGVCVTEVLYLKPGETKNFCIVDAAMNDLPRPAMYQAFHGIVPLKSESDCDTATVYEVVGPVCESGDWIGHERKLDVKAGDKLAVLSAGAYCMSMASNYNSRNRAAEVLVDETDAKLIRSRESFEDLVKNEISLIAGS